MPEDHNPMMIKEGTKKSIMEENSLEIPVNKKDLGIFIAGLLGQPQSIEREIYGEIDIDHEWLINLHYLLSQRIHQQAEASLINFTAEILYYGGLKRTINSFDAFESFNETKKEVSVAVELNWTYLVNFPSKKIPEKQEIKFFASIKAPIFVKPEEPYKTIERFKRRLGHILYEIKHTERTWGDDIESLLKVQINEIIKSSATKMNFIVESLIMITALLAFLAGILMPFFMDDFIKNKIKINVISEFGGLINNNELTMEAISNKLDALISIQSPLISDAGVGWIYVMLSVLGGLFLCFFLIFLTERRRKSYVVLSKEAKRYREKSLKRESRKTLLFLLTFILSITASILANYLYYWISTYK